MADGNAETGANQVDDLARVRQEVRDEIETIRREASEAERDRRIEEFAQRLRQELADARVLVEDVETAVLRKGGVLPNEKRPEAARVKLTVAKVLEAVKEGIIKPPEKAKIVFAKLADKGLTDQSSVYLHSFLQKYLNEDISFSVEGQPKTSFEKDFEQLQDNDPLSGRLIRDTLVETAESVGLTQEEAAKKFAGEVMIERKVASDPEQYLHDLQYTFKTFFREPEDFRVLRALYIPEEFIKLAEETRDEVKKEKGADLPNAEIGRLTSEVIERKIVLLFSKIYRNMDTYPPDKFFEEVEQAGFMESISVAKETFTKRLTQLIDKLSREDLPEDLKEIGFYKRYSERPLGVKPTKMEDGTIQNFNYYKVVPTPNTEQTSLVEFLRGVVTQISNEESTRRYLHNVRALFHRKPEKDKSFWEQIAAYSQQITSTDIDAIMTLPDSDIFITANRLYQKYLEEEFAKVGWMHQPEMFSNDLYDIRTPIEKRVMDDLRKIFPELAKEGIDDWRLRRALSMAIGLARGVLLNEVETAAWADPHMTFDEGKATFKSYYTNDNSALIALNPAHHFLRWQTESVTRGGLIFLLTEGFDPSLHRIWDHSQVLERINYFRESFKKGIPALKRKTPDERMFFELMPNIGGAGSIITRGGWRMDAAYDGWIIRDEEHGEIKDDRGRLRVLDSWKALENIGYEAVFHFVENKLFDGHNIDDFILANNKDLPNAAQARDVFFEYIYKKYINAGRRPGETFESYFASMKPGVEKTIKELIKRGKINRGDEAKMTTIEMYRRLMSRGLAGILRQRIPTKLIRIERNRLSEGGVRAWEKLRQKLGWSNDQMDEAMRNLTLVETQVRQIISKKMRDYLASQGKNQDLSTFETQEYVVNEERIKEILEAMGIKSGPSLELFRQINMFLDEGGYIDSFAEKLRNKDAKDERIREIPFALAVEELDSTFLAWRNSGPTPLSRALGDTSTIDQHVSGQIQAYFDLLEQTALDPKHDMSELIKRLKDMKYTIDQIHTIDASTQLAYRIASMTIAYFKKDTLAKNIFTKWFRTGRKNSLAAEFTGAYRGVWEWEVADIDNFMVELERWNILPKERFDKMKAEVKPRVTLPFKIFGRKEFGKKVTYEPTFKYYGKTLREQFGATKKHIILEMMNKYLPLVLLYVMAQAIARAFKEELGEKRK